MFANSLQLKYKNMRTKIKNKTLTQTPVNKRGSADKDHKIKIRMTPLH